MNLSNPLEMGHNPCFYGISFAIREMIPEVSDREFSHNPCFYGISFAMWEVKKI